MANSWQINCNEVRPSTRVRRRHCSGVICTCGFRSRRAERSRGSNTISGRMNEVSIRIGGRGTATGWGGESGGGNGGKGTVKIFYNGQSGLGVGEEKINGWVFPTGKKCGLIIWSRRGGNI